MDPRLADTHVITTETQQEIQERRRRRYLERLALRVRRLRKQLAERSWEELRSECQQLRTGGEEFGFHVLCALATAAMEEIPPGKIFRAVPLPRARQAVDALVSAIDDILTENAVHGC
jgi:hypothetical protein